jgi:hypothetical protein
MKQLKNANVAQALVRIRRTVVQAVAIAMKGIPKTHNLVAVLFLVGFM